MSFKSCQKSSPESSRKIRETVHIKRSQGILFAMIVLACLAGLTQPGRGLLQQDVQVKRDIHGLPDETAPLLAPRTAIRKAVLSQQSWTDTGYRVLEGQEIQFQASGVISLQKGNPIAFPCGPEGLSMLTLQKPLREENIGSLIGKVVQLVGIDVDENTGEETRIERESLFFIGAKKRVRIPLSGRLYFGINELVVEDNDGVFNVLYFLLNSFTNRDEISLREALADGR